MRFLKTALFILPVFLISCSDYKAVQVWTDRGELALYGEYFNTSQSQYKVTVKFVEFPASELGKAKCPDIVIASWLKNTSTGTRFKSLDSYFGAKKLSRSVFYPRLLSAGRTDRKQYLLPISFNIPALIFSRERGPEVSNQFTIDFNEIKKLSRDYNAVSRGAFTRMGFSPLWDENFLLTFVIQNGASFTEADPLVWDSASLEKSMDFFYNWTQEINTNTQMEEDFTFKYLIEPPQKLIQSRRILFAHIESNDLFSLGEEVRKNLDFRWIMEQNKIPVTEDTVYLGIPKKARSKKAARAFIQWFFNADTQRRLLDFSKVNRINESIFGICGGFSSLSSVTEQVYPLFYPELLGHIPPSENFTPPNVLPGNWAEIRERAVLPYLHDRARREKADEVYSLEKRLADWKRVNR